MKDDDCVILEMNEEVKEKRKWFSSLSPNTAYIVGSISDISCLHQMIQHSCYSCSENAIASSTIFSGPVHRLAISYQYYCQKHLLVEMQKAKEEENEKEFNLLACSFCSRENLSICSNCFIVFHTPWYDATVY